MPNNTNVTNPTPNDTPRAYLPEQTVDGVPIATGDQMALRDYAGTKGYNVDWNKDTNMVTVSNPESNKSINFKSGEGSEYGFGGLIQDNNMVTAPDKLDRALAAETPIGTNAPPPAPPAPPVVTTADTTNINNPPPSTNATTGNGQQQQQPGILDQYKQTQGYQDLAQREQNLTAISDDLVNRVSEALTTGYVSPVQQQLSNAITMIDEAYKTPFAYDPNTDPELQKAKDYMQRNVMDLMNSRGILTSTVTADRVVQGYVDLIPKYRAFAYERYQDGLNNALKYGEFMMKVDDKFYQQYSDQISNTFKQIDVVRNLNTDTINQIKDNYDMIYKQVQTQNEEKKIQLQERESEIANQNERVKTLGFVDNQASIVLGLPVGTPSYEVQKSTTELMNNLILEGEKLNNKITEYDEKAKIDMATLEATEKIKAKQKAEEQAQETALQQNVGIVTRQISSMTIPEAEQWLAENEQEVADATGKYYPEIIKELQTLKKEAFDRDLKIEELNIKQIASDVQKYNAETSRMNAETNSFQAQDASARGWANVQISRDAENRQQEKANTESKLSNNQLMGVYYSKLKPLSVEEAKNELTQDKAKYISVLGDAGYRQLWNSVLTEAIQKNQAKAMVSTPTEE